MVQFHEVDLAVGDVLHIAGTTVTVIDIEDGEVTFRVDGADQSGDDRTNGFVEMTPIPLPR